MKDSIEIYADKSGSDAELLALLQMPPGKTLPARIEAEFDPLGLIRHENIHGAAAEQVYGAFSHVAETLASNDTDIRDELVNGDCVELPKCRIDRFNVFGLRRIHYPETGRVAYELYRDDIGNPDGGFFVTRNADGAVILSRHELNGRKPDDESSPEYADLIHQATLAAIVYAKKVGVSLHGLTDKTDEEHLPADRIDQLKKEYKRENSNIYKTKRFLGSVANTPLVLLQKIITVPDAEEVKLGMQNPSRRISKARVMAGIALGALVMPVPGVSPNWHTPASVVVASDMASTIGDYWTSDSTESPTPTTLNPIEVYDSRQIDLDNSFELEIGSTTSVSLIGDELPDPVLTAPVIQAGALSANGQLTAESPRRVEILDNIAPNQCSRLPIDQSVQGRTYSFGTLDPMAADALTVQASVTALDVCNTSDEIISSGNLSTFVFDVK